MTTPIAKGFGQPWSTAATAASMEVPNPFSVAIGGHPYEVVNSADGTEKWGTRYEVQSVPLLRDQADQGDEPGEQSISPTMLWRRTQDTWHVGAGQPRYDRKTSNRYRFHTSKGVDVWTQGQLSLLPMAEPALPMGASTGACYGQVVGSLFYVFDNNRIRRCSQADYTTYTAIAGYANTLTSTAVTGVTAGFVPNAVTSDGNEVWVSYGANGIWRTDPSITTAASWLTGNVTAMGYAKGRLLVALSSGVLYNPLPTAGVGTAVSASTYSFDPGTSGFTWTCVGEGPNCIYAGGFNGDQSRIYQITIKTDGTALNVPLIAATLPAGEIVRSVYSYLGFTLIGTDKGVRFAVPDSSNNLELGALIPTTSPVYDFEGQDRFVWFTWTNYDSLSTGLGRLDLMTFSDVEKKTPAYASDLMAYTNPTLFPTGGITTGLIPVLPYQGTVRTVGTWLGKRVFTVDGPSTFAGQGGGGFVQNPLGATPASGTIDSGTIGYGVGDLKMAVYADARHDPLVGVVFASLIVDGGTATSLGANRVQNSTGANQPYPANQVRGSEYSLTLTLSRTSDGTDYGNTYTGSPVLHSWTLRSIPLPQRILQWTVPLTFASKVNPTRGAPRAMDVAAEREYLRSLYKSGDLVPYQETDTSTLVQVYDMNEILTKLTEDHTAYESIFVVTLREVV